MLIYQTIPNPDTNSDYFYTFEISFNGYTGFYKRLDNSETFKSKLEYYDKLLGNF